MVSSGSCKRVMLDDVMQYYRNCYLAEGHEGRCLDADGREYDRAETVGSIPEAYVAMRERGWVK